MPRLASISVTGAPPIRAEDQRKTLEVPCSPTTSASTQAGLTPKRPARWTRKRSFSI